MIVGMERVGDLNMRMMVRVLSKLSCAEIQLYAFWLWLFGFQSWSDGEY